jgi:hypothetical protein
MIAIYTKYVPATNRNGSRIKAFTLGDPSRPGVSATISYPHELSHEMVHFAAVRELIKKHGLSWDTENMRYGDAPNGYVFCFDRSIVGQ